MKSETVLVDETKGISITVTAAEENVGESMGDENMAGGKGNFACG